MADPKYANLPGIVSDQPDVFETSDLPEADQEQSKKSLEHGDDCVETIAVSATDAHSKFRGQSLDSRGIDFSDKISEARRTGYALPLSEYEIVGGGRDVRETPLQKYQRLQHEMRELAEELQSLKEGLKTEGEGEGLSPIALAQQVEYLEKQLLDLQVDKLLNTAQASLADPQAALHKRLLTELSSFQTPAKEPGKPSEGSSDSVIYQLYYRPDQAKFSGTAKLADLEQRLERMEAVIGQNPDKFSALTAEVSDKSVLGAVRLLSARSALLDPGQLHQVEARLALLGQKLGQLSEQKDKAISDDKLAKINELYDLVQKWDGLFQTVPHVVERLTSLKDLHEQALQFSQSLTHLDTAQQQIVGHLKSHSGMLKEVQKELTANMDVIKGNCESLDKRIQALPLK